jgi:hypothetical protein
MEKYVTGIYYLASGIHYGTEGFGGAHFGNYSSATIESGLENKTLGDFFCSLLYWCRSS